MGAPPEHSKTRENQESGGAEEVPSGETLLPAQPRPTTLAASQEAEPLVTELFNTIVHEFRTPLAVITGSSSMLLRYEEQLDAEERRELYREIQQAGAVQLDLGTVDISQLVREAIAKARRQVPDQVRERVRRTHRRHRAARGRGPSAQRARPLAGPRLLAGNLYLRFRRRHSP